MTDSSGGILTEFSEFFRRMILICNFQNDHMDPPQVFVRPAMFGESVLGGIELGDILGQKNWTCRIQSYIDELSGVLKVTRISMINLK